MFKSITVWLLVFIGANLVSTNGQNIEPLYIDMLRDLYLSLEKAMWLVIRSGMDQSFVLDKIYQTHNTFFTEHFNEKGLDPLDDNVDQLLQSFDVIRQSYNTIKNYYKIGQLKEQWLVEYAERGKNMSIEMDRIFFITINRDFFQYVKNKAILQNCNTSLKQIKSAVLILYNHYTEISIFELKAYVITQLSYMLLTEYSKQNFVKQALELRDEFMKQSKQTKNKVYELMNNIDSSSYRCDPDHFILGKNYDKVTRLLQGYIDNEVNLNPINDCKRTCEDHKVAKNYQCFPGSYCAEKSTDVRCNGTVVDCHYVGSQMTICPSSQSSTRRYDAIAYDRGIYYGNVIENCDTGSERASSWLRWFVQCSNCFCYCDEPGPKSDRYFSLRPAISNTGENMIVTGVALVKINRIFMWKITESSLIGYGEVNKTTIYPKSSYIFKLNDTGITDTIDYHTLNWKNRSINLDTLIAPEGKIITGIRFIVTDDGHLSIQIRASSFDFMNGKIIDNHSELDWIKNTNKNRTKISLDYATVPTDIPSKSTLDSTVNTFVEFSPTDKIKDVAQQTIPYIDTQFVQPEIPVPLSGIGIYYKGQPLSGGFIAPKIITYNYRSHLKDEK